ncbi:carbohydrate ABC transporter permease [Paenibacillus alginolyticus]|uniref:Carbohydrate ABC transporter permease n=1 Tax=Paenibacillus alginolyticus TaxID=59839 RepID=A0ABT4G683_9BACL|nr:MULTISPECIES: carbohydrate ABC transporter permease [Paenibacillus]MCY9668643.1 carbohydrate ABC transporter permease [Paenibacillus alginolyticus]MCY9691659.1 carbohydrate ABC transporter permease [Paenibacillus alginolyticus]MEC0146905.1 carbohydrate ABC transporter permease [Paenibacillus alginolyticus]NRF91615.1 carbohydrate ABC transporter permease [Paenibacillus frigoriresistens]
MAMKVQVHKLLLHALIITGIVLMMYPVLWMIISSFKPTETILTDNSLIPKNLTLMNYFKGWKGTSGTTFSTFYLNSLLMVGLAVIGNIVSCSLTAYAFARLEFKGKKIMFALMLMTMMIPMHVLIVPQYIVFNKLEWVNTILPIVVPKFFAVEGFFIYLTVQFIRTLPRELDKAATVDGCGPITIYTRIILPLTTPAIVTTTIFTFIWTWNDFFSQLLYLSGVKKYTVTLALRMFTDAGGEAALGSLFAMSVVSIIPVFLIFLFFQRYIVEGIATSGIK